MDRLAAEGIAIPAFSWTVRWKDIDGTETNVISAERIGTGDMLRCCPGRPKVTITTTIPQATTADTVMSAAHEV